jgi:hypothetical protein
MVLRSSMVLPFSFPVTTIHDLQDLPCNHVPVGTYLQAQGPSSRNPSNVGCLQFVDQVSQLCFSNHETVSLAMEAIGDITASAEVSRVAVEGYEFDTRIQGGVFGDGVGT